MATRTTTTSDIVAKALAADPLYAPSHRDNIAMRVAAGILANTPNMEPSEVAKRAYEAADALLMQAHMATS